MLSKAPITFLWVTIVWIPHIDTVCWQRLSLIAHTNNFNVKVSLNKSNGPPCHHTTIQHHSHTGEVNNVLTNTITNCTG